jgi:hypothetical protein
MVAADRDWLYTGMAAPLQRPIGEQWRTPPDLELHGKDYDMTEDGLPESTGAACANRRGGT